MKMRSKRSQKMEKRCFVHRHADNNIANAKPTKPVYVINFFFLIQTILYDVISTSDEDCFNCVTECHKRTSLLCKLYGTPYGWYSLEQALLQQEDVCAFFGK